MSLVKLGLPAPSATCRGLGAVVLILAIGAGWIAWLPPTPAPAAVPPIAGLLDGKRATTHW
jgi:hypothetical protein